MKAKQVWVVFYDDRSGIDKIFLTKKEGDLYKAWSNCTEEPVLFEIDESYSKIMGGAGI